MSTSLLVAFLIFMGKHRSMLLGFCVVVIGQQKLKVEFLHVSVRRVRGLFFCIDVFEHASLACCQCQFLLYKLFFYIFLLCRSLRVVKVLILVMIFFWSDLLFSWLFAFFNQNNALFSLLILFCYFL